MDDPRAIPPIGLPLAPRPAQRGDRDGRQQRGGQGQARPDERDPPGASPTAAVVEPEPQNALVTALDRLRAEGVARNADLALVRLWRGLRAYQAQADDATRTAPRPTDPT